MKNVVLLTVDSLRADHVSCLGCERPTTPGIDRYAKDGAVFSKAFSTATQTSFAFLTLLGGIHPLANQEWTKTSPHYPVMGGHLNPLAGFFSSNGYLTGGFSTNPLVSRFYGFGRGFSEFHDPLSLDPGAGGNGKQSRVKEFVQSKPALAKMAIGVKDRVTLMQMPYEGAGSINSRALDFIKGSEAPFMTWVHYMDVHYPYLSDRNVVKELTGVNATTGDMNRVNRLILKKKEMGKADLEILTAIYDSAVFQLDSRIAGLLDDLAELDLLDDTVIAITADHGDQFMEHGRTGHQYNDWYFDELIRVPLIVIGGRKGRFDHLASLIDLPTTLSREAGADPPNEWMGGDLYRPRKEVFVEGEMNEALRLAVRTDRWKFIWYQDSDSVQLFDLEEDPGETADVSATRVEGVDAFKGLASMHIDSVKRKGLDMRIGKKGLDAGAQADN